MPPGSNASGYTGALADQTVTVTGTVLAPGSTAGSVTTSPSSLIVAEGAAATAIGIATPTDTSYSTAQLTVTTASLPSDGTVLLADGVSAVTAGEGLTAGQLGGLMFKPATGLFGRSSTFGYSVADPAGNVGTGTAALAIGPALGNPVVASPSLTVAEGAPATPLGIAAPTDPNYGAGQLAISLTTLPTDGTVTLVDGTAVMAGEALTAAQLGGLRFTPNTTAFGQSSALGYMVADPTGNASAGVATTAIGPALGIPVTMPGTLTVVPGQGATPIGIQAPTDPNYAAAALSVSVTALPGDGSVDLADGTTPVTLGQVLGVGQLTGLTFLPTAGVSGTQSSFGYAVSDPAGNAAAGSATLAIAAGGTTGTAMAPAAPVLTPGNLLTDVAMPSVGGTAVPGSLVTLLLGGAVIATVSANASGVFQTTLASPLPLGPDILTATATTAGGTSAASAPVTLLETPAQVGGISTADDSTREVANALGRPFGLALSPGTQAVQLLDGTISVAPGTDQGFQARLYQGLFGRAADPQAGYADDQMVQGVTHAQVAAEFLATPEARTDFAGLSDPAFISTLAMGFLGRSFSAAEQATDGGLLASGVPRAAVLQGFADSAEAQAHLAAATSDVFIPRPTAAAVYQMYETGLGRDGELTGSQYATNEVLKLGLNLLQVAQQIATTPEFLTDHAAQSNAAYVGSLWQDGLGRAADATGGGLTAALNAGQITRGDALFAVATTPEAASYLTRYLG